MVETFLHCNVTLVDKQEVRDIGFSVALPESGTVKLTLSLLGFWDEIAFLFLEALDPLLL